MLRAVAERGLPVPRVIAEAVWQDRPALLLSWCPGQTLLDALAAHPGWVWRLGFAFGALQARIHQQRAPEILQVTAGRWIDWAGPAAARLRPALQATDLRDDRLLHLDYHPRNVVTAGQQMTCLIDWVNAAAGDPRADLARTYTMLRVLPPGPDEPWLRGWLLRWILERAWRSGYEQVGGPIGELGPFYAWAGAVMVRDLAPKIGRPGIWLEPRHLAAIERWTDRWMPR